MCNRRRSSPLRRPVSTATARRAVHCDGPATARRPYTARYSMCCATCYTWLRMYQIRMLLYRHMARHARIVPSPGATSRPVGRSSAPRPTGRLSICAWIHLRKCVCIHVQKCMHTHLRKHLRYTYTSYTSTIYIHIYVNVYAYLCRRGLLPASLFAPLPLYIDIYAYM